MKIESAADLVKVLREYKLLQPDQLAELAPDFLHIRFPNARLLAKYLLQRSWLTVYQTNRIFQGCARELAVGPYRVLDLLGEGGVSSVYKAWDTRRKCVAALKMIRAEHLTNEEAVGRLQREIRVVSQLSHPNIVKAFDVEVGGDGHYFAMEYVEGTDLGKKVKLSGPLPRREACLYTRQAALGLQHAHEHGLVHRDIKPGNLLVTVGGATVKILDMGMTRVPVSDTGNQADQQVLTTEGALIGTPDYISPEQAKDPRTVDTRADIYSLGCTLFHLLAGQPPFPGKTVLEKLYKHQTTAPDLGPVVRATGDPSLAPVIEKMMAKKPDDRYATPAEVAEALRPFCS